MQILLRAVEKDKLPLALKGASEKLRELFFKNMSERAGKMLKDDIDALGPVKLRDVDDAQAGIVVAAKELAAQGADRDQREQGRGAGLLNMDGPPNHDRRRVSCVTLFDRGFRSRRTGAAEPE